MSGTCGPARPPREVRAAIGLLGLTLTLSPVHADEDFHCSPDELSLQTGPPLWDSTCDTGYKCFAAVPFSVRNCTAHTWTFELLSLQQGGRHVTYKAKTVFDVSSVRVPPGEVYIHKLRLRDGTPEGVLTASLRREDGLLRQATVRLAAILSPVLEEAKSLCPVCNGVWGPRGMSQLLSCRCRASDQGQPCDDGEECQGLCLFDRYVESGSHFMRRDGERTSLRPRKMYRPVGHCSEFTDNLFGCYTYLRRGASRDAPVEIEQSCTD